MQTYRFAKLIFTAEDGRLRHEREELETNLRPQAARLLQHLLDNAGEVVPRERLFEVIWGDETVVDFESGLAALLRELRQAIRSVAGPGDLIETVPRRGYRLNAEIDQHAGGRQNARRWRLAMLLAALLPVLVGTGYGVWLARDSSDVHQPAVFSLAILPFDDYEKPADLPDHVGLLIADTLLAELLTRPTKGLQMLGRTSLRPYLDRNDVVSAVADDLGVDLLIEGSVSGREGGEWRAELRLLDVPPGRVIWSTTAGSGADEKPEVRAVAAAMADELAKAWPEIRRQLSSD
ncbi:MULTISPECIES: winged helix-turn-helix domain-containing protein [unclassified Wenzhouxiangella]|uniref:winged helix-turn-helix domain-containing protein n=1 Tax=unclassified Wenzhouxiangella TaxID=2613841 RepID=UPI0015F27AD7|nr:MULTISPECIES: winged helix-turn-helix domain-containing protein [unclassified Wenzhouxiangella]